MEREVFIRSYPLDGLAERLMKEEEERRIKEYLFEKATYEKDIESIYEGEKEE